MAFTTCGGGGRGSSGEEEFNSCCRKGACDEKEFGSSAELRLERVEVGQRSGPKREIRDTGTWRDREHKRFCFIQFYYLIASIPLMLFTCL